MAGVPSSRGFVDSGASVQTRYAMYGALIGALLPVVATLLRVSGASEGSAFEAIRAAHADPVFWLLDLLPACTTTAGWLVGGLRDRLSLSEATITAAHHDLRIATRALEESTQRAKARQGELARAQSDLDRFTQVASRDLAAPLAAIQSLAEWVREDLGPHLTPAGHEHLELLKARTQRLSTLLHSLQAFSMAGRETDEVERVDVKLLAHQMLRQVPGGSRFIMSFDGDDEALFTSRTALSTVLYVLLDNCVRHHDQPPGRIYVTKRDLDKAAELVIADDGPGIPTTHHERVFGLFVTLKRDEAQTAGAGLSVARRVVETAGGEIALLPQDGRGTRVRLLWPKERTAEGNSTEALARLSLKALAIKKDGPPSRS